MGQQAPKTLIVPDAVEDHYNDHGRPYNISEALPEVENHEERADAQFCNKHRVHAKR
jgi:hypothetical protein